MGVGADPGARSWVRTERVTIAVWVTLMGIMVFLPGISRTICAASAVAAGVEGERANRMVSWGESGLRSQRMLNSSAGEASVTAKGLR